MVQRSQSALAAMLLTQRLVETPAKPLASGEYWRLVESVGDPGRLLGCAVADLVAVHGLDPALAERVAASFDAATAVAFSLDEAEQSGIRVVVPVDQDYPGRLRERLGRTAPALLYVVGDPALLSTDLLGVVGSRNVAEAGADVARRVAQVAAANTFGVASGAARGVDQVAMEAALAAGGTAAGVCADSLARAARSQRYRQAAIAGRLCLCSPYRPTAGFTAANAMARNKIIYALSQATLVVAADDGQGGTWFGASEALRQRTGTVLVWRGVGAGNGNAKLVSLGAAAVESIDGLFPLPDPDPRPDTAEQLTLQI
jgi:predicted Rossmann fold nucleotide-binding protein DprA/Smf involved in DNA uptake